MIHPHQPQKEYFAELLQLLGSATMDHQLISGVDALASEHGNCVYKEILGLLVGKRFGSELSGRYWREAVEHSRLIFNPEYAGRAFRPALLDYLCNVAGVFNDPRIIEADYLHNITRSSVTDGLTGLYNQTYFKDVLASTIANQRRSSDQSFALLLLDLDRFKQYNDRCGHLLGDEALRLCAGLISGVLRDGDMAARYGGEEFALLLAGVDRHGAHAVAERIREEVEKCHFPGEDLLEGGRLTISGGIAVFPESGETAEDLIGEADAELYRAKERRNTIYNKRSDRRRNSRRPVRTLVEYASFDGALFRPALSTDISEGGMGLGCENLLPEGTSLSIRLTRPFWPKNLHLTATVRQVRRKNELVCVGLEFEEPLDSLEELISCRQRYPSASP